MKRVMCVWLPSWPLQRIRHNAPESSGQTPEGKAPAELRRADQQPLVLYAESRQKGLQVVDCCRQAAKRGVIPGMPLAEAKGLLETSSRSTPLFARHQPAEDLQALQELALWCHRFSPIVGLEEPDSLLLDLTGCAHLFGGEQQLAQQVQQAFQQRRLIVRTAIADTIGAAWGVAHYGPHQHEIVPANQLASRLKSLPVQALRLTATVVETLEELDIRRIERLLALPRTSLPSRFGTEIVQRLDQALGQAAELITPIKPPDPVTATRNFEYPLSDRRALEIVLQQLTEQIVQTLQKQQQGLQRLDVTFQVAGKGEDGGLKIEDGEKQHHYPQSSILHPPANTFTIELLHPSQSLTHILELTGVRLERLPLQAEVTGLQLNATATALSTARQTQLFAAEGNPAAQHELARLIDRLSNRLGKQSVVRPRLVPDAQPEFANHWQPLVGELEAGGWRREDRKTTFAIFHPQSSILHHRPLFLYRKPQAIEVTSLIPEGSPIRFSWRQTLYDVAQHWGPERIETGWYRGRHVRRDYYRIETDSGLRFWLFRRIPQQDWFLHGTFD